MSVAIIPMARQFGWNATVSGFVQSAFFYGYMICQLPAGFLNTKFSGARMLPMGVGLWSTATAVVPFLGSSVVGLCASRSVVGMGEAVAPASLTDMVAKVVPVTERSRSMTFVGSALYLGSLLGEIPGRRPWEHCVVGLLLSPLCVEHFGWPSVFYVFGGVGIVWTLWWLKLLQGIKQTDPYTYRNLMGRECTLCQRFLDSVSGHKTKRLHKKEAVPWRAMLRCRAMHALIYTHFCNNW